MDTNPKTIAATLSLAICAQAAKAKGITLREAFAENFGIDGEAMYKAAIGEVYDMLRESALQR